MKITKISPAAKTAGRYNVFVDEEYSFSLDEIQLVQLGIKKDTELNAEQLAKLKNESDFGKNYIRALDLVSRRPRSIKEIKDYARKKGWNGYNTERVINRLIEKNYLDDVKFAKLYARSRAKLKKYSLKRIRMDLNKKGISSDLIDKAILELGLELNSDQNTLKSLIEKKAIRYSDVNKLKSYLLRNGFYYDDINKALDELDKNEP